MPICLDSERSPGVHSCPTQGQRLLGREPMFATLSRFIVAAVAALATGLASTPSLAGKKDHSLRFGYDQVLDHADPYFNSVRIGVILGHQVWDTLIYRDPTTNDYKEQLATDLDVVHEQTAKLEAR